MRAQYSIHLLPLPGVLTVPKQQQDGSGRPGQQWGCRIFAHIASIYTTKWIFYLIWTDLLQCVCWRQSPGTLSAPAYDCMISNRASILILIIPIDKVVGGHRKGEAKETQGEEIHFIVCSCRLSTIFWLRIGFIVHPAIVWLYDLHWLGIYIFPWLRTSWHLLGDQEVSTLFSIQLVLCYPSFDQHL